MFDPASQHRADAIASGLGLYMREGFGLAAVAGLALAINFAIKIIVGA